MAAPRLTPLQWLICAIAALGFAFDIYEILMAPLVVGPAIGELTGLKPGTPDFNFWVGMFFWIPALVGGAFGLVGGYLTDRFGRRRVLVWSILLYAFSAFGAGFATNIYMLLILRSTTYIGVFVEFVAAVAWVAEIFPDARQREKALGYTQAFSSIGGLMVTGAYYIAVTYGPSLPAIAGGHSPWRYTLISGVIPALPLILIRPFLPESPAWQQKRAAGTLKRPSLAQLFTPELRRTTIVTTLMFAFAYGAAFGAIQQMPRIVPGIEEVRGLPQPQIQQTASQVQAYQEFGGLAGRFLLAGLALYIVSRRQLIRVFQIPGLIVMPLVFYYGPTHSLELTKWGMFAAGVFTVGQLSFWGNYLPRVYPVHLRGTGESCAANIGGRMIGTSFAAVLFAISGSDWMFGNTPTEKLAYTAAAIGTTVFALNLLLSFWLPEPESEDLPD
jgi:MFS family permease